MRGRSAALGHFRKDGGGCADQRPAGGVEQTTAARAGGQPTGCAQLGLLGSCGDRRGTGRGRSGLAPRPRECRGARRQPRCLHTGTGPALSARQPGLRLLRRCWLEGRGARPPWTWESGSGAFWAVLLGPGWDPDSPLVGESGRGQSPRAADPPASVVVGRVGVLSECRAFGSLVLH